MKKIFYAATFLIIFVASVCLVYFYFPTNSYFPKVGVDWMAAFQPAALNVLAGQSPYNTPGFYNPPWLLLPLLPIALLPTALGAAIMFVLNFFGYVLAAAKLKINVIALAVFLLFSNVIMDLWFGNVEGLVVLGFILPPQIGLFFILCKPQFGIGVAIFWIVRAWMDGGISQVIRILAPVSIAFMLSFVVFGFWPAAVQSVESVWWNTSIFPAGVPIGLILLVLSIWKGDIRFAIASSPFFAPYLAPNTWAVAWLGLLLFIPQKWNLILRPRLTI